MSPIRWILLSVAVLAALIVASLTAEPGEWRQAIAWSEARLADMAKAPGDCPVLVGKAQGEGARERYEQASKLASTIDNDLAVGLRGWLDGESGSESGELLAAVPADALAAVREAARLNGSTFSVEAIGKRGVDYMHIPDLMPLVDALLIQAREGERGDRVACWLDALAIAVDIGAFETPITSMVGGIILERTIDACRDDWLRARSTDELRALQRSLRIVDGCVPCAVRLEDYAVHLVLLLNANDEVEPGDIGQYSWTQSWRNGFSVWREGVDRSCDLVAWLRAFERATPPEESWPSRRRRLVALANRDSSSAIGGGGAYLGHIVEFEEMRRTTVAKLRLLRMAVAFHLGEHVPELADPMGTAALVARRADAGIELRGAAPDCERQARR